MGLCERCKHGSPNGAPFQKVIKKVYQGQFVQTATCSGSSITCTADHIQRMDMGMDGISYCSEFEEGKYEGEAPEQRTKKAPIEATRSMDYHNNGMGLGIQIGSIAGDLHVHLGS